MGIEYIDKTHARLVVSSGTGKQRVRRVKRITYTGKKDAERQYREFEQLVNFNTTAMTVSELLDWYIDNFEQNGGKATTARGYRIAANAISDYFGKAKARDVTISKVEQFIKRQDASPKTIKNRISLLKTAYTAAIRRGMLDKNPCEYAMIPKQVKPDIRVLTEDEVARFMDALHTADPDFKVFCELALFCGLRRSEIYGLLHSDVSDTVSITKTRHRLNGKDIIQSPKTAASIRVLALPEFVQNDIRSLIADQTTRPANGEYLIQNPFGEPVGHSWGNKLLAEFLEENELPHITVHGLRHTCASMLIQSGIPIAEVSAHLGHASIDITLRTYTHLFRDASTASKNISKVLESRMAPKRHQAKEKSLETQ